MPNHPAVDNHLIYYTDDAEMHTRMSWCPADTRMPRSDFICSCHRVAAPEEARRALVSLHPTEPSPGRNGNTRTHHWLGQRMATGRFLIQALMLWCTKCHPQYSNECKHVFDLKIMNGLSDFLLCPTFEASACKNERSGQKEYAVFTETKWWRHSCNRPL